MVGDGAAAAPGCAATVVKVRRGGEVVDGFGRWPTLPATAAAALPLTVVETDGGGMVDSDNGGADDSDCAVRYCGNHCCCCGREEQRGIETAEKAREFCVEAIAMEDVCGVARESRALSLLPVTSTTAGAIIVAGLTLVQ